MTLPSEPIEPVSRFEVACVFCRLSSRERPRLLFYLARGHGVCEGCIDILSALLEDDRSTAPPTSRQRPTPRHSIVELQQVISPP
jgi:hypothetical protein